MYNFKTPCSWGSNNAVGKRIPQIYSAISKEMTLTSGDYSWFIKFHNRSSDIRGGVMWSAEKIVTINVEKIKLMQYSITH